jgi:hypothetical protein
MKEEELMDWIKQMNEIKNAAKGIVSTDIIYINWKIIVATTL